MVIISTTEFFEAIIVAFLIAYSVVEAVRATSPKPFLLSNLLTFIP